MKGPSLLLFDLGGVLIENSGFERLNVLLPEPIRIDALKKRWLASSLVRRFELGHIPADEFAERFVADWEFSCSPEEFLEEFVSWPKGFYPGAQKLLADLRQVHRVGCLSNSNVLHWEKFGGLEGHFDVALSSHVLGVIKPDQECFERALHVCGVEANEVLFFDDSIANVLGARRLGIRAWHVNGVEELKLALRKEGLLQ